MASITSPTMSPNSYPYTANENIPTGPRSPPLLEPVSSASQLPRRQAASTSSSDFSPEQLVEIYKGILEQNHLAHDIEKAAFYQERMAWKLEIQDLRRKIEELKGAIHQPQARSGSESISPRDESQVRNGAFNSFSAAELASRIDSAESVGNEVWRGAGGRDDALRSTRTFPDSPLMFPPIPQAYSRHFHGIEASGSAPRSKSVGFGVEESSSSKVPASIPGSHIDSNLDGISFKGRVPDIVRSPMTPTRDTSSPMDRATPLPRSLSTSSSRPSGKPHSIDLPSSDLTAEDRRVQDAGHTPLARVEEYADSSPLIEAEGLAKEPYSPIAPSLPPSRPPNERASSYFPLMSDVEDDPALKGPLALDPAPGGKENNAFITQLNSKLLDVQRSNEGTPNEHEGNDSNGNNSVLGGDGVEDIIDEPDPPLRMKNPMNFGSQFGVPNLGKGFL